MIRWLGSAVPAKPPKQKLFGDKPKYLPGFGGTPGGGTPTPPAEPPKKKEVSGGWVAVGAIVLVVGAAWWLTGGKSLAENPYEMTEAERKSRIWELKFDLSLWQGRERDPKRTPLQRSIANDKVVEIQRELLALQKKAS